MPERGGLVDDIDLVAAARRGDRTAFGQLYTRFAPMIFGILLTRMPRQEAEDLAHDVFLTALKQLHTLRKDAAFPGWLATIARNRARDHCRRTQETTELPQDLAAPDGREGEAGTVLAAIRSLPKAYSEPLILRLVEGMTGDEIAARTGLTPASVRVNLHRGMKRLRAKLKGSDAHEA
ncbi:MAG: sigma-70 family RNA polymerase sigma factor [Acidobacteriia bacterium]|nr:sigma-70 family RNA polymerase sigma factor [Terriglobia bacterium]